MELHEVIKRKREGKGLSQLAMSEQLSITPQAYWAIEKGKTEITVKRLFEIAKVLEVNPLELLGLDNVDNGSKERVKELEAKLETLQGSYDNLVKFSNNVLMAFPKFLTYIINAFKKDGEKIEEMTLEEALKHYQEHPEEYQFDSEK